MKEIFAKLVGLDDELYDAGLGQPNPKTDPRYIDLVTKIRKRFGGEMNP
jgi:hypothetical protein